MLKGNEREAGDKNFGREDGYFTIVTAKCKITNRAEIFQKLVLNI